MHKDYLFQSERLGFRNWSKKDLPAFAAINADEQVMEHFPKTLNIAETESFIDRLIQHYEKHNYNYFATELLTTGELIGFIGLVYQTYEMSFTPNTDIGWRLKPSAWGKGYATEGAKRCLWYGFTQLNLDRIISTCTLQNGRSEKVMRKIGMTRQGIFKHPRLEDYPRYQKCVWYDIKKSEWSNNHS